MKLVLYHRNYKFSITFQNFKLYRIFHGKNIKRIYYWCVYKFILSIFIYYDISVSPVFIKLIVEASDWSFPTRRIYVFLNDLSCFQINNRTLDLFFFDNYRSTSKIFHDISLVVTYYPAQNNLIFKLFSFFVNLRLFTFDPKIASISFSPLNLLQLE